MGTAEPNTQRPAGRAAVTPAAGHRRALRLVATAERRAGLSRRLPHPDAVVLGGGTARTVVRTGRWPLRRGRMPRADLVLLPQLRGDRLRVRGFYPQSPIGPVTLAVHERPRRAGGGRLVRGAATMDAVRPYAAVVVPRLHRLRADRDLEWVLEDLVPGAPPKPPELEPVAAELLDALLSTWARLGTSRRPLGDLLTPLVLASVEDLLCLEPIGLSGPATDAVRRLRRLAAAEPDLTVSLCHGDPVLGNTLRMPDGRLALVDWELAGCRPVGADVAKVLVSVPDPQPLLDRLDADGRRPVPVLGPQWRLQLAAGVVLGLAGWRRQEATARRSGRDAAYARRLARRVALLEQVLQA